MGFQGRGGVFAALPETMKSFRRSRSAPVLIVCSALWAASCAAAPVAWERPGGTQDQWIKDKAACQFKARGKAEKRFRQRGWDASPLDFGTPDTLSRDMARFDAKRDERRLFEDCLAARGYTKKEGGPRKQ